MIKTLIKVLLGIKAAGFVMEKVRAQINGVSEEVDVLARTIYGEARGEGLSGMQAVANVVMNRVHNPSWWGSDVVGVCKKPYQFSCWNKTDPNFLKITTVTKESDPIFETALAIAEKAVNGTLPDITNGATHYHTTAMTPPAWSYELSMKNTIGSHIFYA